MYAGLVRKSLLLPILAAIPDNIRWSEDVACMMLAYWDAQKVVVLEDVVYHYRIHALSTCRVHDKDLYESQSAWLTFVKEEFLKRKAWGFMQVQAEQQIMRDLMLADYKLLFNVCKDFLFPFTAVHPGMKIVLYGMGDMGQEYWRVLHTSNKYELNLVCDRNWKGRVIGDDKIASPEELLKRQQELDRIVITVTDGLRANLIKGELVSMGIEQSKIALMDQRVLNGSILDKIFIEAL